MPEDRLEIFRRNAVDARMWEQGRSYVRLSRLTPKILLSEYCGVLTAQAASFVASVLAEFLDDGVTMVFVDPSRLKRYEASARDKIIGEIRPRRHLFESIHVNLDGTKWTVQMVVSIISMITRMVNRHTSRESFEAALVEAVNYTQPSANHG